MSNNILTVPTKAALDALVQHEEREVAFCEENNTYYCYTSDNEWQPIPTKMTADGLEIDLYALNKQVIAQLPPFDLQRLEDAKETLENWKQDNIPYLLYGREISYFTLFYPTDKEEDAFVDCVFDCLAAISSTIYSFDIVSDGAIEIWMDFDGEATVFYLFDYSEGMVYYHG